MKLIIQDLSCFDLLPIGFSHKMYTMCYISLKSSSYPYRYHIITADPKTYLTF